MVGEPKSEAELKKLFPAPRSIDPCLCGSRKRAGQCCLKETGQLVKSPSETKPPAGPTKLVTEKCYAGELNDCDGDSPTKEHYISAAVLELMGDKIDLGGAPWKKDDGPLSISALTSRILCKRHNNVLSGLDSEAARLFNALIGFHKGQTKGRTLFSGEDIERWMLKTLAGIVASGTAARGGERVKANPSREYLEILFGEKTMPLEWGLHYFDYLPSEERPKSQLRIRPEIREDHGRIIGVTIAMVGCQLRLNMGRITNLTDRAVIHRPRALVLADEALLELSWQDSTKTTGVVLSKSPPP